MKKRIITISMITVVCLLIDQLSKFFIVKYMNIADTIHIIKNFFRLTYVQNTGAAWSILSGNQLFLIGISLIVLGLFIYMMIKNKTMKKQEMILVGVLLGGIIGNLIDRIRLGYVIDFFDFNFGSYNFPIFNIADIFIVLSGFLIILMVGKEEK